MGFFEHFPYTNFHDLNLDWIIQELEKLTVDVRDFISINAIKYADPIQWNITSQYEKNTVVLDKDGNAYLSVQPVPAGVSLDRTEYWTNIGNFSALWESVKEAIAIPDEGHNKTASSAREPNTLVWVNGDLLEVTKHMSAGDMYVTSADGNSRPYTMQMLLDALIQEIKDRETETVSLENKIETVNEALTTETNNRIAADNQIVKKMYNVKDYGAKGDGVTDDTESFKTTISAARGNGVVIVPSGSYIINAVECENIEIKGFEAEIVVGEKGAFNAIGNAKFIGLKFNGTGDNISIVINGDDVTIEKCVFTGNGIKIGCVTGSNIIVENCYISGDNTTHGEMGIWFQYESDHENILIENNIITNTYRNAIFGNFKNSKIRKNRILNVHNITTINGGAIDLVSYGNYISKNVVVESNFIDCNSATCGMLEFQGDTTAENVIFSNNVGNVKAFFIGGQCEKCICESNIATVGTVLLMLSKSGSYRLSNNNFTTNAILSDNYNNIIDLFGNVFNNATVFNTNVSATNENVIFSGDGNSFPNKEFNGNNGYEMTPRGKRFEVTDISIPGVAIVYKFNSEPFYQVIGQINDLTITANQNTIRFTGPHYYKVKQVV